jgi:hypothetical protein
MIQSIAALPPDGLASSSLVALLAPITIVAASAVALTLAVLIVGIVNEGRDSVRRRRIAKTADGTSRRDALRAA